LLGYALLSEGYAADAIPHLQIAHDSGALGIAQLQADHPAEAIVNLGAALSKNPSDPDTRAHEVLGQHYYAMKMLPEAIREYEQALAQRPDLPGLRIELGQIYAGRSEWAQAEEQFREETKLQSGNAEAAYRLGDTLLQEGKMTEAAENLHRSDLLRPDMPETLYSLARATIVSNPASAELALNRVIEIEKQTPLAGQAYLLLAGIHRKQGKTEQAMREMAEYRRIQTLTARGRE
jgi:tetratricopeptide (TPR) repeat protein